MVVGCDEESSGSTLASSPNDIVTGSIIPENFVELTEGRGSTPPQISNEISKSWDDIRTPESGEGLVSKLLSSASPTRPSCNLDQSDASQAAPDDGDSILLFNPHERNRFDSWRESLLQELVLTQGYFYDIDTTQITDCEVGQLSQNQKSLIDEEYRNWMEGEVIASPHRKGANRRSRRREAQREKAAGPAAAGGRRARRRTQYARVQKLFRKNRSACAKQVLSGDWVHEVTPSIPLEDQVVFWSRVFGEMSQPDERDPIVQGPILWDLIRTIALPELFATLRKTKEGAVGPDKVLMRDLKNIDPRALLAHFNLWLYVGYQPADFRRSRTVLIPKSANPEGPGQYRPISISSFICHAFHRLLADRLSGLLNFTSRQRAFVKGDGIADNVFLLRCLLRDRCEAVKPLSLAFLDVSKAFDSVSHESLLLAVKRMGVPGPFVEYLRSLYAEASTTLQVGDQSSDPLQENR